jgi:hypothetical protein
MPRPTRIKKMHKQKKIDDSICYASFHYHDRIVDILSVDIFCRRFVVDIFTCRYFVFDICLLNRINQVFIWPKVRNCTPGLETGRSAQRTGPAWPGPTRPGPGQRIFYVQPGRPTEKDQWAGRAEDFVGRPGPTTLSLLNFIDVIRFRNYNKIYIMEVFMKSIICFRYGGFHT